MASTRALKYRKTKGVIEKKIDRLSELPEPIMVDILSRLPLEDYARASVLSKSWKSVCSLNPVLYYDHNLFALRSLVGGDERKRKPDINRIRDMFLDDVHDGLSRAMHLDSPIRKLALKVAFNDSTRFSRLDKCLELVKRMKVEELCVFVQSVGSFWSDLLSSRDDLYEFQISALASKHLRSVYIRGCMLSDRTFVGDRGVSFCSLLRLSLSNVVITNSVFENLVKCCGGIEMLVLDDCTVYMRSIKLSRFPKLKNALIKIRRGRVNHIGIVDTNFECFKCRVPVRSECRISPAACASIKELTLLGCTINQPSIFADLAATFPLVEEADIYIHDTEKFNVVSNLLRKLKVYRHGAVAVKEASIDCARLTFLDCCQFSSLVQLYVNCPKLRVLNYRADAIPKQIFFSPMPDLEESTFSFTVRYACDTLWFIDLRTFLALPVMTTRIKVVLDFVRPEVTFEPERVEAIQAYPRHNNIHLILGIPYLDENVAAIVDAVLFIIRPTTFVATRTIILEYLCEKLKEKSEDKICDDEEEGSSRCWLDLLDDFRVENSLSGNLDIKADNVLCQPGLPKDICFHLFWSK